MMHPTYCSLLSQWLLKLSTTISFWTSHRGWKWEALCSSSSPLPQWLVLVDTDRRDCVWGLSCEEPQGLMLFLHVQHLHETIKWGYLPVQGAVPSVCWRYQLYPKWHRWSCWCIDPVSGGYLGLDEAEQTSAQSYQDWQAVTVWIWIWDVSRFDLRWGCTFLVKTGIQLGDPLRLAATAQRASGSCGQEGFHTDSSCMLIVPFPWSRDPSDSHSCPGHLMFGLF